MLEDKKYSSMCRGSRSREVEVSDSNICSSCCSQAKGSGLRLVVRSHHTLHSVIVLIINCMNIIIINRRKKCQSNWMVVTVVCERGWYWADWMEWSQLRVFLYDEFVFMSVIIIYSHIPCNLLLSSAQVHWIKSCHDDPQQKHNTDTFSIFLPVKPRIKWI